MRENRDSRSRSENILISNALKLAKKQVKVMAFITKFLTNCVDKAWGNVYWLMMEMDVTQWGVLAVIFVVSGFMALRTRL